jgi:hypothetical protein
VAEVEVEVAIHEIGELFNVAPYILESGHLAGSVEIEIPVNRKSDEISIEANEMHVQGRLSLQDITAGKCKSVLYATKLNGQLDFGNRIRFSGLTGRWLGFPVQVNGSIPDISGLLASQSGQHYLLEAVADRFVLDTLLSRIRQTDATEDSDQPASRWDLKCRFTAGKFSYGHFNAQDVNGTLSMDNNGVRIDPVTYYALDGYGTGQFEWMINQEKNPVLRAYTEVQQVDITKLFSAFNNFGQSVITSENIEGSLSGNVAFQTGFTSGGDPDMSSMLANASVAVTSGRLKHVEALYSLSKFIKLSELEDIHFSTLKNEIFIQNNTVIIPSMHIGSSALDLDLYGTQSFDNQFIYHIRLLLSDLLFRKASKADRNHNQYGIIEDDNSDRTSIYLVYKGDGDNSSIAYDKDRARQARKEALAREGRALKTILQQDLGLFKKDSLGTETTTEERKKFRLTFPDEVDTVKKDTGKGRSPHTYSVKWEDELPDSLKKK